MTVETRVIQRCYPPWIYYVEEEGGTLYKGIANSLYLRFPSAFPNLIPVTDLSLSNKTLPAIQTLKDGRADVGVGRRELIIVTPYMCITKQSILCLKFTECAKIWKPSHGHKVPLAFRFYPLLENNQFYMHRYFINMLTGFYGMTWTRHQMIDYTAPMTILETVIISRKGASSFNGNIIKDVFDYESYILFLISFLLLTGFAGLVSKNRHFVDILLDSVGSLFGQNVRQLCSVTESQGPTIIWILLLFINFFMNHMYKAVIISKLTTKTPPKFVDTYQDLIDRKDLQIYVVKNSYIDESFKALHSYNMLKDRIDYIDYKTILYEEVPMNLVKGSHVLLSGRENLNIQLYNKLSSEIKCRHPITKLRPSKDSLFSTPMGLIHRKGYRKAEEMSQKVLLMVQAGLQYNLYDETGIWSENKPDKLCKQRVKVTKEWDAPICKGGRDYGDDETSLVTLSLDHMWMVFTFWGAGIMVALLIHILEVFGSVAGLSPGSDKNFAKQILVEGYDTAWAQ